MAAHSLNRRLDAIEERAIEQAVQREAERLGALVACEPSELIRLAVEAAALIERHGWHRTIELIAADVGVTAEQLETRAAELARDPERAPCR